jgi:hypothetical protein
MMITMVYFHVLWSIYIWCVYDTVLWSFVRYYGLLHVLYMTFMYCVQLE